MTQAQTLEVELGRYKKRCNDLMKINAELAKAVEGVSAVTTLVDALHIQTALTYGEDALDPDTGKPLGTKRLVLPIYDARELVRKYEVHSRRDEETGSYIVAVGLRNDERDEKSDEA